tara:strand:- start:958 stop:1149 length:192 start_codon:yes stop_codon:yes gene_type:complete
MKEINEIKEFLNETVITLKLEQAMFDIDNSEKIEGYQKQLDNADKVGDKLQGAIDLFKEIEEL